MSQAEVTMGAHSGLMEEPAFSVPAKKMAMWLFIIADTRDVCRLSGGLRIHTQRHSELAQTLSQHHECSVDDIHPADQQFDHALWRTFRSEG